jgi:hypothetical protein
MKSVRVRAVLLMGLEFDRDSGALWAACDNTCAGVQNVLGILGGKLVVRRSFARPTTLPDSNHEGIAIAPTASARVASRSSSGRRLAPERTRPAHRLDPLRPLF